MSQNGPVHWLVTYDIANPRRLTRVFKFLNRHGVPIQYSVFSVEASSVQMGQLMAALAQRINSKADDVRAYRLPAHGWRSMLGASILPDGILINATPLLDPHQL